MQESKEKGCLEFEEMQDFKKTEQTSAKKGRDVFDPALSTKRNQVTSSGSLLG